MKITKKDMGCWIDGSFGVDHVNKKLANLLLEYFPACNRSIYNCLVRNKDYDLQYDAQTDAVDLLQTICEEDVEFFWIDGDLILSTCELIGEY
jgi:hypothetical protein